MEQITENHNHLMELLGTIFNWCSWPVLYLLIDKYKRESQEKKRDKVKETIANTTLINDELEEIREEFKSDRVWISQFHNGGNFYPTGKSIQKFSIFYEVTNQEFHQYHTLSITSPLHYIQKHLTIC